MNTSFNLFCRWLLISVLCAAPFAIAKHQLDHFNDAQTLEHCDLCVQAKSLDCSDITPQPSQYQVAYHPFQPLMAHSDNTKSQHNFLYSSRAPPV